jgi:hypothetical protein
MRRARTSFWTRSAHVPHATFAESCAATVMKPRENLQNPNKLRDARPPNPRECREMLFSTSRGLRQD